MRPIDADELMEKIRLLANRTSLGEITLPSIGGLEIVGLIMKAPTIDAVPVVRCKDCQYAIPLDGHAFRRWGNNALNCTECRGDDGFGMAGVSLAYHDGFCDMGVRRGCEPHD